MRSPLVTLYGIANCDTVKKSRAWLTEHRVDHSFHDFKKQGVPADQLAQWATQLGWESLVNKKGSTWRKLDAATQAAVVDAASAQALMLRESSVIKRPVVVNGLSNGKHITVGYVPEVWATWAKL